MIPSYEIYDHVAFRVNKYQGGEVTTEDFNRVSWLAQLSLIDWLNGSFSGQEAPELADVQKNRDWLSFLVTPQSFQVTGGVITRPEDYYGFENLYKIGGALTSECENEDGEEIEYDPSADCNTPIQLLENNKFNYRCTTWIKTLKPSFAKPISKQVGKKFEFAPKDLGSITLEYIRLPKKSEYKTTIDPTYNEEVADKANSVPFEWGEEATSALVYFIVDEFMNHTREKAGKEFNNATGKSPRG